MYVSSNIFEDKAFDITHAIYRIYIYSTNVSTDIEFSLSDSKLYSMSIQITMRLILDMQQVLEM